MGEVKEVCLQTQRCRVQWPGDPTSSYNADRPKRTWVAWKSLTRVDQPKKFACEFYAEGHYDPLSPGAEHIALRFSNPLPERVLMIEVGEAKSLSDAQTWARAIAVERDWRYIQAIEVNPEFLLQIRSAALQDTRAARICVALGERPL